MTSTYGEELNDLVWLEPWRPEPDSAELYAELSREVSAEHPLSGKQAVSVARHANGEDVLFHLPGNIPPLAVVRLTWSRETEEGGELPYTIFYDSVGQFAEERMVPDHLDSAESAEQGGEPEVVIRGATALGGSKSRNSDTGENAENSAEATRRTGVMYAAVMSLVFSVLSCLLAGLALDRLLDTSPWLVVVGIVVGAIVGFYQFIRLTSRIG